MYLNIIRHKNSVPSIGSTVIIIYDWTVTLHLKHENNISKETVIL